MFFAYTVLHMRFLRMALSRFPQEFSLMKRLVLHVATLHENTAKAGKHDQPAVPPYDAS